MDETVQGWSKETLPTRYPVEHAPPDVEHGGVVVNVQERNLIVLLPQNEEYRVQELNELGEVVPPQYFGNPDVGVSRAVEILTLQPVTPCPGGSYQLNEHVER